jgi:cell division protein FtsL
MLVLSGIVYLMWQRTSVDLTMKNIDELRYQSSQVNEEIERTKRQITKLKKFSRIQRLAKKSFGLKAPKQTPVLIVVNKDRYKKDQEKLHASLESEKKSKKVKLETLRAGF